MKKKLLVALCICTMGLSACSSGDTSTASAQPVSAEEKTPESQTQTAKTEEETTEAPTTSAEISIDNQEIYNQDGVKITVTGFSSDGFLGPEVKLLLENSSDKGLTVQTRNSSVNGYMMNLQISADVAAGKKANDGISISNSDLKNAGVETITDIEFSLHIFDTESWDTVADSDQIVITTSASATYEQAYDASGDVLYDSNGLKIISKGLSTEESLLGPKVILYLENNSEQNVTIQTRDCSVNGFMIDPIISAEVGSGKKSIDSMTFSSSQLEENQITSIEEIEASFHIFNTDGWDTIEDTEPFVIKFN